MWRNARKTFDQEKLEELATSLLDSGEAHHAPVGFLVTDEPGTEIALVMGERRWRAYRLLRDRGHLWLQKGKISDRHGCRSTAL
jgi:ParB-like chromosome segregation protein Spo0J